MGEPDSVVVVLSTVPAEAASKLARTLVGEGLCACVNLVGNVQSTFYWKGELAEESETLAIIKTTRAKVDALLARLPQLHPYDVPEALVLPVERGLPAYLAWVGAEVSMARGE